MNAYKSQPVRNTYGVTWQEEYIIGMLEYLGPVNGSYVLDTCARECGMSPATAHKYLQLTVLKKFVRKQRGKDDYRMTFFVVTQKGKKFLEEVKHAH